MSDSVSRETAPPPPDSAAGAFSSRLSLARRYADWLAGEGTVRGLIGPREVPRLWERHLLNCAVIATEDVVPCGADVADLGSGAGLPGLVLALARPDVSVTLVEPLLRRATFLEEVVADLSLDTVQVVRARAEELHGGPGFDVVTARALSPLVRLVGQAMPLVRARGELVAMKGSSAPEEVATSREEWEAWGCAAPRVEPRWASGVESSEERPTMLVRIAWRDPGGLSWPPRRRAASESGP